MAGTFGEASGGAGESGMFFSGVNDAIVNFGTGGNQGDSRPGAYLNFILFDKNYKVLDAGWQLAPATTFTKQKLSFPTKDIKEAGYIYVWLSYDNASNVYVYFDDMKVTHTKSNIIQSNEYYPFGLVNGNSWTRDNSKNSFLYNAGSELNSNTGWYETFFRDYDATLGRFHQIDPLAHASSAHTPYNYAYNSPVILNDPMGDRPQEVMLDLELYGGGGGDYQYYDYSENWTNSYAGYYGGGGYSYYHPSRMQGPQSGNYWGDGMQYPDWNPNSGSATYRAGLAAGGYDKGGKIYYTDKNGVEREFQGRSGQYGHYEETGYFEGVSTSIIDEDGNTLQVILPQWVATPEFIVQQGPGYYDNSVNAFNEMWRMSHPEGSPVIEVSGFLVKGGGVIILPTSGQLYNRTNPIIKGTTHDQNTKNRSRANYLPYDFKNGKYIVFLGDVAYEVVGYIHTHPYSGNWQFSRGANVGDEGFLRMTPGINTIFSIADKGIGMGSLNNGVFTEQRVGSLDDLLSGSLNIFPKP